MKLAFRYLSLLGFLTGYCALCFAGQFEAVVKYKINDGFGGHYSVILGDFNGDGVLDIAATRDKVWILLGNGDGTFQPAKSYLGSEVAPINGLASGDFNKDGKLDLAVASADSQGGGLNILLGNGDGTFQRPVIYPAGPFPVTVAVADFNGDGSPDVAVASPEGAFGNQSQNGGIAVLLGNGNGTFQPYVLYSAGVHPNSPVVADFNGDHIPDLATGTTGSIVAVLLGNGDGTFRTAIRNHEGVNPNYVGIGDFNNDGKVDVVTTLENPSIQENKVVIALGNGDGTLQAPITILPAPPKPQATAVADFTLDGFQDLAIGALKNNGLDGMYFFLGQGNASFTYEGKYATGTLVPIATAVGDLNSDGYPDLVVLDGTDSVEVLLNTGAP